MLTTQTGTKTTERKAEDLSVKNSSINVNLQRLTHPKLDLTGTTKHVMHRELCSSRSQSLDLKDPEPTALTGDASVTGL